MKTQNEIECNKLLSSCTYLTAMTRISHNHSIVKMIFQSLPYTLTQWISTFFTIRQTFKVCFVCVNVIKNTVYIIIMPDHLNKSGFTRIFVVQPGRRIARLRCADVSEALSRFLSKLALITD